jgi:hypothetical protein
MSGRDRGTGRESTAGGREISRHFCYICQRPRSSSYHARHPIRPGDVPVSRVCSRCIRKGRSAEFIKQSPVITVYEVHHYHHMCLCTQRTSSPTNIDFVELPASTVMPQCAELSSEGVRHSDIPYCLSRLQDRPPEVRTWRKPNMPATF